MFVGVFPKNFVHEKPPVSPFWVHIKRTQSVVGLHFTFYNLSPCSVGR